MFDETKRQREMRSEVAVSRQAADIVKPINERLANWQASAALLAALSRNTHRSGSSGRVDADLRVLSGLVKAERQALAKRADELPAPLAASSRILDTRRALQNLEQTLDTVLKYCASSGEVVGQPKDFG